MASTSSGGPNSQKRLSIRTFFSRTVAVMPAIMTLAGATPGLGHPSCRVCEKAFMTFGCIQAPAARWASSRSGPLTVQTRALDSKIMLGRARVFCIGSTKASRLLPGLPPAPTRVEPSQVPQGSMPTLPCTTAAAAIVWSMSIEVNQSLSKKDAMVRMACSAGASV